MKYLMLCIIAVFSFSVYAEKTESDAILSPDNLPMYYVSNIPNDEFLRNYNKNPY
ncbi:MAG: hypothetical protein Q9M92_11860 [Enterobacterales bacterium]|nr:hypothetical protein [Enterobacterales bacterium]